jgi:hypothetical protein
MGTEYQYLMFILSVQAEIWLVFQAEVSSCAGVQLL